MKSFFASLLLSLAAVACADEFPGWQGLRVIKVDNGAHKMMPIRERADGGQSLLVVETRQSRLTIYRYVGARGERQRYALDNPNFLPMAEDFEKEELPMPRLPHVATVFDVDGDGIDEIFVVQGDPRKVVALQKRQDQWEQIKEWSISESDLSAAQPILVRETGEGLQILVSLRDGVQIIDYAGEDEVEWLQPRERDIERNRWWLVDLDGDGDEDLVEARNTVESPVRWYESEGKRFRPAINISDAISNTNVARLMRSRSGPRLAFLGANQANTISFYELGLGDESKLGKRNLLPLAQPDAGGWASVALEQGKAIVELGRTKPVLNLYLQEGAFWSFSKSFPVLKDTTALNSVGDAASTILLRVEGEGQLYLSRWENGRFSFPKRLGSGDLETADWKLLAFDQFERSTWWVSQRGSSLVLNVWDAEAAEPREVEFPGLDGEFESCVWLGGERLLVKKKFSRSTSICSLAEGKAVLVNSRFKGEDIRRIRLHQGSLYLAEQGVVQKLDENLEVIDQIMLDGDYSIRSFAPVSQSEAYALEDGGEHVHRLELDDLGIFQTVERIQVPHSLGIEMDNVLGLTLISSNSINVPSEGSSNQLVLESSIDPNGSGSRDYERRTLGTLFRVDIDGDGVDEIATVDYGRRDIIVYGEQEGGEYREVISWKVYDDGKYPYGQDNAAGNSINPYRMLALDIDGDGLQDLVLASHDRLLIYLAKDSQS